MESERNPNFVSNEEFEAARAKREVKPLTETEKLKNQVGEAFRKLEGVDRGYKDLIERLENPKPEYTQGSEALKVESETTIPSTEAVIAATPEVIETRDAAKTEVMERAREGRQGILLDYLKNVGEFIDERVPQSVKSLASVGVNYAGFIGTVKMGMEAYKGETVDGKKLTALGRINHGVVQGLFVSAWALGLQGNYESAAAAYAASWAADGVQYYPEIIASLIDLADKMAKPAVTNKLNKIRDALDKLKVRELFFEKEKPKETEPHDA
jgi:hypothetical protein